MIKYLHLMFGALFCAALFGGLESPAVGKPGKGIVQFKKGEEIAVKDDKAYVLMRYETNTSSMSVLLMRIPSTDEMTAYETAKQAAYEKAVSKAGKKADKKVGAYENFLFAYGEGINFYEIKPKRAIWKDGKKTAIVAELPAGSYVVYGIGWNGYLHQCLCFGTVGFKASKGEITDIGKILIAKAWEPSNFPELAGEDDLGKTAVMDYGLFAVGLKPKLDETLPAALTGNIIVPANFYAVGPYADTNTLLMNRMAAVPGVLAYDDGKVIDVASGKEAPPNF